MKKLLILLLLVLATSGCKKRPDAIEAERAAAQAEQSEAAVEWKITAPSGTYMGHKVDMNAPYGTVKFISDGKVIIVHGDYTMETQAK